MNKKQACALLDVNLTELAEIVSIKYDSLRSLKEFSAVHLNLIRWELDKRLIKEMKKNGNDIADISKAHVDDCLIIDIALEDKAKSDADKIARAEDSGL